MIVKDEALLDEFRAKRFCEYCGTRLRYPAEPHHFKPRGMGGGSRLDVPENLIALGGPWDCACHHRAENALIPRADILVVIACREKKAPEECWQVICDLLAKEKTW